MSDPDPMPTVLEHWNHPTDMYNQSPNGQYAVAAWLPRLGPCSFLLWSTLASQVTINGAGVTVDLVAVAENLGLGLTRGLPRSLKRMTQFRVAKPAPADTPTLLVRTYAPPVPLHAFEQMAPDAQRMHLEIFGVRTRHQVGLAATQ